MQSIRAASVGDAQAVADIYAPYVAQTAISFEDIAPTAGQMAERIEAILRRYPFLVIEDEREVLGYAYGSAHATRSAYRWSADVSVYVRQSHHGAGLGRALYTALLPILARQGFHAAFAGISLPNAKSVGLHEAMGFCFVGAFREVGFKFGRWHDVGWWRLPLSSEPPLGEPKPFAAVHG